MATGYSRNTVVIYRGPSAYNGHPIVVFATGFARGSKNPKTGNMLQVYLVRDDMSPLEALRTGQAGAICGGCPFINNGCYVQVGRAPMMMWGAYQRGRYESLELAALPAKFAGRPVRLGAYGDPAAMPIAVWEAVMQDVPIWTGYTHGWRSPRYAGLQRWCMASVESDATAAAARRLGWATFRVRPVGEPMQPDEIQCPASKEAGHLTNCLACGRCGGREASARLQQMQYISIAAHGATAGRIGVRK